MAREHSGLQIPLYGLAHDRQTLDSTTRGVEWRHVGWPAVPGIHVLHVGRGDRSLSDRASKEGLLLRRRDSRRRGTEEWKVGLGRFRGEPIVLAMSGAISGGETHDLRAAPRKPSLTVEQLSTLFLARLPRRAWSTFRAEGRVGWYVSWLASWIRTRVAGFAIAAGSGARARVLTLERRAAPRVSAPRYCGPAGLSGTLCSLRPRSSVCVTAAIRSSEYASCCWRWRMTASNGATSERSRPGAICRRSLTRGPTRRGDRQVPSGSTIVQGGATSMSPLVAI